MCVVNQTFVRQGKTRGIVSHDTLWADRDACFLLTGGLAGRMRHTTFVVLQGMLACCFWRAVHRLLRGCSLPLHRRTLRSRMGPSR
jgi:hypothetical protein